MISPQPNDVIEIDKQEYRFFSMPQFPEIAYCEIGRKAKVYKLITDSGQSFALKVFKPHFRSPRILEVCKKLAQYSKLPGMELARRDVLTKENNGPIIAKYPDLEFAVLMPWIEKEPWASVWIHDNRIDYLHSLSMTKSLSEVLLGLEEHGLAHTDLSGSNVLIDIKDGRVTLVGLETMFGHEFPEPENIPAGSPGYAHPNSAQAGQWCGEGDRFSASLLFAEILTISRKTVNQAHFGETFFSQNEIGEKSERYSLMINELHSTYGDLSKLFAKAWLSKNLKDCPTIHMWYESLSNLK